MSTVIASATAYAARCSASSSTVARSKASMISGGSGRRRDSPPPHQRQARRRPGSSALPMPTEPSDPARERSKWRHDDERAALTAISARGLAASSPRPSWAPHRSAARWQETRPCSLGRSGTDSSMSSYSATARARQEPGLRQAPQSLVQERAPTTRARTWETCETWPSEPDT